MATYYAINAGGNWSAGATWSTIAEKNASRTGGSTAPTNADDCIIDDYSGNVTINTTSCVAKSLVCTGHTGTLTFTSGQKLTLSGDLTFGSGMTVSGTGMMAFAANAVITFNGLSFDGTIMSAAASKTFTLGSDLNVTTLNIGSVNITFSGSYDINCSNLYIMANQAYPTKFPAGQEINVSTVMAITTAIPIIESSALTIQSGTAGSAMYLNYSGTAENCIIFGVAFTDVDASGSAVPLLNWYGKTLTRTDNIYNVTSADFPAVADVKSDVEYGGVDDASANRLKGTYSGGDGGGIWMPRPRQIGV